MAKHDVSEVKYSLTERCASLITSGESASAGECAYRTVCITFRTGNKARTDVQDTLWILETELRMAMWMFPVLPLLLVIMEIATKQLRAQLRAPVSFNVPNT